MTKSPKVSFEEKIMRELDNLNDPRWDIYNPKMWVNVKALFKKAVRAVRKDTLEAVEREVKLLKTGLVDAQDDTVDEVLSLISGMKGGKNV